jgi:myo-inositol-1(or 4)-monophosphatase
MTAPDLPACARQAERLARAAGDELLRQRAQTTVRAESKGRRRELVTQADRAAEQIVVGGLLAAFPEHAVLAEEGVLTTQGEKSKDAELTWIVDPLDGTTNFVHGLPFFCVAIALARGNRPVVAVVHAPALGETFVATDGGGALRTFADGRSEPLRVSTTQEFADALLATGFSYNRNEPGRDDNSGNLARILPHCRDLRRLGSAELDLCLVAAGVYDGYWERYLAPYDVAAGALLVREAGGVVTDFAGGDEWLFGDSIVASNGRVHGELRRLLGVASTVHSRPASFTRQRSRSESSNAI